MPMTLTPYSKRSRVIQNDNNTDDLFLILTYFVFTSKFVIWQTKVHKWLNVKNTQLCTFISRIYTHPL